MALCLYPMFRLMYYNVIKTPFSARSVIGGSVTMVVSFVQNVLSLTGRFPRFRI
jgi:hypothetical protein